MANKYTVQEKFELLKLLEILKTRCATKSAKLLTLIGLWIMLTAQLFIVQGAVTWEEHPVLKVLSLSAFNVLSPVIIYIAIQTGRKLSAVRRMLKEHQLTIVDAFSDSIITPRKPLKGKK